MDISLVTSLFRSESYLETFSSHVLNVAAALSEATVSLEMVLVANDASEAEHHLLRNLVGHLDSITGASARLLAVERETIYASWNRGIQAASGRCVGFWNVDDVRTPGALLEGLHLIDGGELLVYFPYDIIRSYTLPGGLRIRRRYVDRARPFDREQFARAMHTGPFFLFARDLYTQVGPFDDHFRISGDFEWCVRALDHADFCPGTAIAGRFAIHGDNLSNTGSPLETVENNAIQLRCGAWHNVIPADPDLMRDCWQAWGSPGIDLIDLPAHIQTQLWGNGAYERWQRALAERRRARRRIQVTETLRALPRFIINRTGTRSLLARWGLVKSAAVDR
ncbi:MAG: hypothetical protein JW966_14270 [Anaerolineae bacterium]|nr:hypothetical protein [Anaerolineae bacterium]